MKEMIQNEFMEARDFLGLGLLSFKRAKTQAEGGEGVPLKDLLGTLKDIKIKGRKKVFYIENGFGDVLGMFFNETDALLGGQRLANQRESSVFMKAPGETEPLEIEPEKAEKAS